jgi:GT2 family glycosyltransferase
MIAVITITYNRLEITKRWLSQLKNKAGKPFYHIIVDNGSTDDTINWLKDVYFKDQKGCIIKINKNIGVIRAWQYGIKKAIELDAKYIVKYDNDCEILSDDILEKLMLWYDRGCNNYVIAPLDIEIKDGYHPRVLSKANERGYNVQYTSHTGGIFQVWPVKHAKMLINCKDIEKINGDLKRGHYLINNGISPIYITDLKIAHRGNDHQSKNYIL